MCAISGDGDAMAFKKNVVEKSYDIHYRLSGQPQAVWAVFTGESPEAAKLKLYNHLNKYSEIQILTIREAKPHEPQKASAL